MALKVKKTTGEPQNAGVLPARAKLAERFLAGIN